MHDSLLGHVTAVPAAYDASVLYRVPRTLSRRTIGLNHTQTLPFSGWDIWHHYEVSWLNENGSPEVACARLVYSSDTPYLIESKSLKLYFNSLNMTRFANMQALSAVVERDCSRCIEGPVTCELYALDKLPPPAAHWPGTCVDDPAIHCDTYTPSAALLEIKPGYQDETLYSHVLRSNCPVTGQPDWGSVAIAYRGRTICRVALMRYIVAFRSHTGFHEACVEHIFMDVLSRCQPDELTVYAAYTRRGGLDINPYRSTQPAPVVPFFPRLLRQ